jgi:hypothetical protein
LGLAANVVTDAGARAIAAVRERGLRALDLTYNLIGVPGERALRARFGPRVRI